MRYFLKYREGVILEQRELPLVLPFPRVLWYNTFRNDRRQTGMNRDSMSFVVYMIHRCANEWGLSPAMVYRKLKESGCIEGYLVPHYGVLHTQSSAYVLEDIEQYLRNRGIAV